MGPVTAIAYGITIGDFKLVRMGVVTEVVSLLVCVIIGLVLAGIFLAIGAADEWPTDEWPTDEMTNRGTLGNFYAGIPIAFFSGLGVAVGLLDSQTNSLVGVAISASLLPPAVNSGMLLVVHFSEDGQFWDEAMWSLLLTVMNIVVIIVASMLMFRLKEVRRISCFFSYTSYIYLYALFYLMFQTIIAPNRRFRSKRVSFGRILEWRGKYTIMLQSFQNSKKRLRIP